MESIKPFNFLGLPKELLLVVYERLRSKPSYLATIALRRRSRLLSFTDKDSHYPQPNPERHCGELREGSESALRICRLSHEVDRCRSLDNLSRHLRSISLPPASNADAADRTSAPHS
jgi:hypothetical protein